MATNVQSKNGVTPATTTIGPTIVIRGRLKVDEDLIIKGRIEAEITSSKAVTIESSGVVKANIRVQAVCIRGMLVGNIHATDKVEIEPEGRVIGDLVAPRVILHDGAAFRGHVDMTGDTAPAADARETVDVPVAAKPAPPTPSHNPEETTALAISPSAPTQLTDPGF
jgi:cytoskeletal protein CcmA (bactofilin family)